jgi:hypothetical protein
MPLARALASGRPAIVPDHSSYPEWVDDSVGLIASAHAEPTSWPMDGLGKHATTWNRVDWSDLRDRLVEGAAIADEDHRRYERLSAAAREQMITRTSIAAASASLREAIRLLPARPVGAFAWA